MRPLMRALVLLAAAALLVSPGLGQVRPLYVGALGGPGLVMNADVQKELKLSEEQITQLKKMVQDLDAKQRAAVARVRGRQDSQELKKLTEDSQKALATILQPEQLKRLRQIEVQQRGLGDAETQQTLKLSAEQTERIVLIELQLQTAIRDIFETSPAKKDTPEKVLKLKKEAREKAVAVLTDDQKKTWKDMTGEPFYLASDAFPGRLVPLPKVEPRDIKKNPNIPDIYRTPPAKKIEI